MQQRNGSQWMLSKQWGNKKTLGGLFGNVANYLEIGIQIQTIFKQRFKKGYLAEPKQLSIKLQ